MGEKCKIYFLDTNNGRITEKEGLVRRIYVIFIRTVWV
jgi:hypothetical protein